MNSAPMVHQTIRGFVLPLLVFCCLFAPQLSRAQDFDSAESSDLYSREELAQMLAPIALYPDALLTQVLMASTYPIEVIEADRWTRSNPQLQGEALDDALLTKDWDPSVKAVCHFPSILALMSERISETTNLGNAFLAQEAEVMDMIQGLRVKAHGQGNLTSNPQQQVIVERETIIIAPANPRVIYVPYYDPFYIYGPWWYPAYPPYYWGPAGVSISFGISYWPGIDFGFSFGSWSYFDWHHHHIFIDVHKRPRFVRHDRWISKPGRWQHVPHHRRGVAYRDKSTARKFGQSPHRSGEYRRDVRGFPERENLDQQRDLRGDDRPQVNRNRLEQLRIEREMRLRERTERERPRADTDRSERHRLERQQQSRERVERDRQERVRIDRDHSDRRGIEREAPQKSRDNLFNRIDDGRKERQSSDRGRFSRQGQGSDSRGRFDGDGRNRSRW